MFVWPRLDVRAAYGVSVRSVGPVNRARTEMLCVFQGKI